MLKLYYHLKEINNQITHREIIFKPKGAGHYKAVLTYTFGDLSNITEFVNEKKMLLKAFSKSVQKEQIAIENKFIAEVTALRLEALLTNQADLYSLLLNRPIIGEFKAYIVE